MRPAIRVPEFLGSSDYCRALLEDYIATYDHMRVEKALKDAKESNK